MNKRQILNFLLSAALLLSFSAAAFADAIQGRVAKVGSSALELTVYDAQGNAYPNALHLKIDSRTKLDGLSSVWKLKKQNLVNAEVSQQKDGSWRADSISKLEEAGSVQQPATPPSSSLLSTLTQQKVVRNALLGAITGAVAAKASGGRAGKGALVGAGAGVAGGLLADMFSSRSQSQSSATVTNEEETRR